MPDRDPNADVDGMTLEALQAEFVTLGDRLSKVDVRRRRILKRMTSLKAQAAAKVRVASLTDVERAALCEVLGVKP